jgi:Type II secretion system (T2SS), protein N
MPTSRSRPRGAEPRRPPARASLIRPLIPVVVLAVLAVAVIALPASLIKRVLPSFIAADDFSGTLWHGTAGAITIQGRPAGALEWHLHPAALLTLTIAADLHWVNVGFVADATAEVNRHGLVAHAVQGGGPIEDLAGAGFAAGWHGTANFKFEEIRATFVDDAPGGAGAQLESARGTLEVANVSTPTIANGAGLGGYRLHVSDGADISDTGGPVDLKATLHVVAKERTGTLSGTIRARPDAPAALRSQIESLGQMHAPDASGRIPVEMEFSF